MCVMACDSFAQCFGIVVAKFSGFLGTKILFLSGMEMFLHLFYDMFSLMKIVNFKI